MVAKKYLSESVRFLDKALSGY